MIALLLGVQIGNLALHTINLNEGWKFARLSSPPSIWTGPDAVPTSQWKVLSVSSQETQGEKAEASRVFDGDPKTFWHTQWQSKAAPYPHELVIDLGVKTEAIGFRLLPRQTGPQNGKPNHIQVYFTNQVGSWGNPVVATSVPNAPNLFQQSFPAVSARYLRLVVTDGYRSPEPFLAIAELGLIRNLNAQQKKDWESQYHIATVEASDDRFDLKGDVLEKVKDAELVKIKPTDWRDATLPHAAWVRPLNKPEIWQGVTYYKRHIKLANADLKKSIELTIGAAMQVSDLWLNGEHIATRRGGYLPLVANLTGKAKLENDVLVRVDNQDNPLVPPGKPQQDLDFMYGAGITREAHLDIQPFVHMVGIPTVITLNFDRKAKVAKVLAITSVRNDSEYIQDVFFAQGAGVGRLKSQNFHLKPHASKVVQLEFELNEAEGWSPGHQPLEIIDSYLMDKKGNTSQQSKSSFYVRTVQVSREQGFTLNGLPLELIGTNRHQDYPWVGPSLSVNANYRDAKLIKESGHNIVRLSHYPQSEEFLNACDQLGLMVIPCIAGWQFLNKDPRFEEQVKNDIQELVMRDARHPCVAWFETSLNETYPPNETAQKWADAARSTPVGPYILLAGDARKGAPWDIAYNQWKDQDMSRPQEVMPDKPGYVREYGDYEFGGAQSSSRVRIGEGTAKLLQETWNHIWSLNHLKPQLPWTMGFGTWEMFDHNVPWEFSVSASGLCDLFRREKPSFWFYRGQTINAPYAKLAADWQPGTPSRQVIVFTNCDEAILKVNGREVARSKPERGKTTNYSEAKAYHGSNTGNLAHPPIIFRDVKFQPGTLTVEGISGKKKAVDSIKTAGRPAGIKVWFDDLGVPIGPNDLVFVRAAVVDANGTICPKDSRRIHFHVKGAKFAGESDVACEMGVASALIRTPFTQAKIEVSTEAKGLTPGQANSQIR